MSPPNVGRPAHIYGSKPALFNEYWSSASKYAKPFIEAPFGAVAYAFEKGQHFFRVSLVPTDAENQFYWVRLTTPDGGFDFVLPAVMAASDLPRLIELWELEVASTVWVPGPVASPALPKGWRPATPYSESKAKFFVVVKKLIEPHPVLELRAGIHTLTSDHARCMGIVSDGDLSSFQKLPEGISGVHLNEPLNDAAVTALRHLSANYFRKTMLTVGKGRTHPFIPHATMLGIPAFAVTEFKP